MTKSPGIKHQAPEGAPSQQAQTLATDEPASSASDVSLHYGKKVDGLDLPVGWNVLFQGYGGADKWETKVYLLTDGREGLEPREARPHYTTADRRFEASCIEIRIPEDPALFPPKEVMGEYYCLSALTLQEAISGVIQARAEKTAADESARAIREAAATKANAKTTVKTCDLVGGALDWAVALCEDENVVIRKGDLYFGGSQFGDEGLYCPSMSADQAWPIIEREHISMIALDAMSSKKGWAAELGTQRPSSKTEHEPHDPMYQFYCDELHYGQTSLVAAMRCYVASKLGNEVAVPEALG